MENIFISSLVQVYNNNISVVISCRNSGVEFEKNLTIIQTKYIILDKEASLWSRNQVEHLQEYINILM